MVANKQVLFLIYSSLILLVVWFFRSVADHRRIVSSISLTGDLTSEVMEEVEDLSTLALAGNILKQLAENGSSPCHKERTAGAVLRVTWGGSPAQLAAATWHSFTLVSMTRRWRPRCAGGDYYEVALEGERWRSRPRIEDCGNGSYFGKFLVPSSFAGDYNFSVHLLFDAYHGMDADPQPWVLGYKVVDFQISIAGSGLATDISSSQLCRGNFPLLEWDGYWARGWFNHSCGFDSSGRLLCLDERHKKCRGDLCEGDVDRLESNGWVYRKGSECLFRIWNASDAWDCLHGKWIFFWGDSNHADTARNLLYFVLGLEIPHSFTLADWQLPRSLDRVFYNPKRPQQWIHLTLLYNGHVEMDKYGMGLGTMYNATHRETLLSYFNNTVAPDVVVMNSGLHDGFQFPKASDYVDAVNYSIEFWEDLWTRFFDCRSCRKPSFVYRTTVAPAGESRSMKSNPCKMEAFNRIMVDRLRKSKVISFRLVDGFDMTFPWHFDNQQSDGGHYGRAPLSKNWPWLGKPHFYFVDVMLAHILLNLICL